jgi:hypothetical protein
MSIANVARETVRNTALYYVESESLNSRLKIAAGIFDHLLIPQVAVCEVQ